MLRSTIRPLTLTLGSVLVAGLFAACGAEEPAPKRETQATEPDGGDAGPSAKVGCEAVAAARCDRLERCSPHMLRSTFGTVELCTAREKLACAGYEAPGVAITGSDLLTCAGELPSASCEDFLRGTLPAACTKPGTLERHAACGADYQCASGACGTHGEACGTCTLVSRPGDECNEANCAAGNACISGTCVKLGKTGASCDVARLPCLAGLMCSRGRCAEPIRNEESECDPDSSACDVTAGLYCDRDTNLCKPVTLAKAGEACGFLNRVFVTCEAGAQCLGGECKAPANDGDSCTADAQCAAPARCLGGRCTLAGAAACK